MNEPRDTVVGDALRRLDVPDHAPDFWGRLDQQLAGSGEPGDVDDDVQDDAEVIELASARATRRTRSARVPAVAAAAAAVALALAVGLPAAQQAADGEEQVDVAQDPDRPAPDAAQPAPETTPAPSDPTPPATDPAATMLAAEELAGEWLSLIRADDAETSYDLLDDWSRAALPFEPWQDEARALAEGAGAFAGPNTSSTAIVVQQPDGDPVRVVTFTGEVEREGIVEFASYAVAITGDGDDLGVRFAPEGPMLTLDGDQVTGTTLTSPLPLLVSPTAALWVSYDGREPEPLDQAGQSSIELDVAAGGGTHIVTLVAFEAGGITVRAYPVLVP